MKLLNSLTIFLLFLLLSLWRISSCDRNRNEIPSDLMHIDSVMDYNPRYALKMLVSMEIEQYQDASDNIRMKLALLKVKAADKCLMEQKSDSIMKAVVKYYDRFGSCNERMEAYYYLGCAYRDMHDYPHTMEKYKMAIDLADTTDVRFDWELYAIMYTQLAELYNRLYMTSKAIDLQKKVIQIETSKGLNCLSAICTLANLYEECDSMDLAGFYYDKLFPLVLKNGIEENDLQYIGSMLSYYTYVKDYQRAKRCYDFIRVYPMEKWPVNTYSAVGEYCEELGMYDSALFYATFVDNHCGTDICRRQSSLKYLYALHKKLGNGLKAAHYAELYIQYTDSAESERDWKQAVLADKMYQYTSDLEKQQMLERQVNKSRIRQAVIISVALIFGLILLWLLYQSKKKNCVLQKENKRQDDD